MAKERRVCSPKSRYPTAEKALAETNSFRVSIGLKPIVAVIRRCLACGEKFKSYGNRTCGCKKGRNEGVGFDLGRD